jgi:diaminopropionate ammonia-lyase
LTLPGFTFSELVMTAIELELNPTPLLDLPGLAQTAGVARLFLKNEGKRPLGNFKVLGGMRAGLHALERHAGGPRRLICASDGNHGLAVAAAARSKGAEAHIYLPKGASPERSARILEQCGHIAWIDGTYDDAVEAASEAATRGEGILVPDTTDELSNDVVADVMTGYGRITAELAEQLPEQPTHMFVQAGVGGLAAAMAEGLADQMESPGRLIVVEPAAAACVAAALHAGKPVRIEGDLNTCAEMLSCGLASAPALHILLRCKASAISVSEQELTDAVYILRDAGGPSTTPSGAAGLAGLLLAAGNRRIREQLELTSSSRVLLIASERDLCEPEASETTVE